MGKRDWTSSGVLVRPRFPQSKLAAIERRGYEHLKEEVLAKDHARCALDDPSTWTRRRQNRIDFAVG
jgi:hypothetical protein